MSSRIASLFSPGGTTHHTQLALWLLLCCLLIAAMVVLGGVTRLTRSGLSIVEWAPISGVLPPLTDTQWEQAFADYQRFPEYQKLNRGMRLAEFKSIFWMEYAHRLLGRLIGIAFLLPFAYFLLRRRIDSGLALRLAALFTLGAAQGLLGWIMVKSGLVNEPRVSPYRLSAHLALAVLIYGYALWLALGLLWPRARNASVPELRRLGLAVTALVCLMIVSGGFVAGTRAGFAFNSFPLMNGHLIPPGVLALTPFWRNFFENIATVQLDHRLLAYALCLAVGFFWYRLQRADVDRRTRMAAHALLAMLGLQVALGISTLLLIVPTALAAAHQAGALAVLTIALFLNHELRRHPPHHGTTNIAGG